MTDYSLFLGSFHPVVVHLPIGVLLAAFVLHLLSATPRFRQLYGAVGWLYGLAAAGGIMAVATGWALAGPTGASWDTHRWFGLGALALGVATAFYTLRRARPDRRGAILALATVGVTAWAGHLGGAITHGEGHFVQYAPAELRGAPAAATAVRIADPDSVLVYADLVRPILEARCVNCHRRELAHGRLRMDSYVALLRGGSEGDAISPGTKGELWKRVSLPPEHPRFMPTRGHPLAYDELIIVRSWLEADKDSLLRVVDWQPDATTLDAIERRYNLNVRPLPYVERARPVAVSLEAVPRAWSVQPLSDRHTTLSVRVLDGAAAQITDLLLYTGNITILSLKGVENADDWLAQLPDLPHLTKIDWTGTDLTDAQLDRLARYPHLEEINLTNTQLTDTGLTRLGDLPTLKRLFIYGTAVSEEARVAFVEAHPTVQVPGRFAFGE